MSTEHRFPVAILSLSLAGLLGCRQIAGISEAPQEELTSTACGLPFGASACASCVNASCCPESSACAADPACAAYQSCLGRCDGDAKCRAQCTIDNPGAVTKAVSELSACLAGKCEGACGLTCGAMAEYFTPPDASAPCDKCFEPSCDQMRACASSIDCDQYTRCMVACPTPDCREACADAHDAGAALFAPVQQQYAHGCSGACAYGENWNCVGHVVWPAPIATTLTIAGTLRDYNTTQPTPGATICWSYDPSTCGDPGRFSSIATADMNGVFTNTFTLPSINANGGTQPSFQGWARITAPNFMPAWALMGFPQTQPKWIITPDYVATTTTAAELSAGAQALGVTLEPSRALLSMRAYDCLGSLARNVRVAIDPVGQDSLTRVYYNGGLATGIGEAGDASTNETGLVLFFNVLAPDAGDIAVGITATPVGLGVVSSREGPVVQAGVNTAVEMPPTP